MAPTSAMPMTANAGGSPGSHVAPADVGDQRAEPGADERDADEVREDQMTAPTRPPTSAATIMPTVLLTPISELASQRAENEAVDAEHERNRR